MWGRRVRKCGFFFPRMLWSLYDYQSKASMYRKRLTYLKNCVTTSQKHIINSQKPKREHKYNTKGKSSNDERKNKRKKKRTKMKYKINGK